MSLDGVPQKFRRFIFVVVAARTRNESNSVFEEHVELNHAVREMEEK